MILFFSMFICSHSRIYDLVNEVIRKTTNLDYFILPCFIPDHTIKVKITPNIVKPRITSQLSWFDLGYNTINTPKIPNAIDGVRRMRIFRVAHFIG